MYVLEAKASTVTFDFKVDEVLTVPDIGTVKYTVRDNAGLPMTSLEEVAVTTDANTTRVQIPLSASTNTFADSANKLEKRTINLFYDLDGVSFRKDISYVLSPWLNFTASADDVRKIIGISQFELMDDEIDLFEAYYEVKNDLATGDLDALLVDVDRSALVANRAITYRAAIACLPSLQLRTNASEGSDTLKVSRLSKIDFSALRAQISKLYSETIGVLDIVTTTVAPTLLTLTTPTDVITGV